MVSKGKKGREGCGASQGVELARGGSGVGPEHDKSVDDSGFRQPHSSDGIGMLVDGSWLNLVPFSFQSTSIIYN